MKNTIILFILMASYFCSFGQKKDSIDLKNGIDKPSMLTIHHFGLFSARINQNFKAYAPERATLNFSLSSANTFHPFVEMYIPDDEITRNQLRQEIWYNRHFFIDQETTPAAYSNIIIDAVFRNLRIDFNTKITKNTELGITLRSYLVTKGKYPFSVFTSDEGIEWFHSNIAGGEDPFGRRYYGLNQVNVKYTDRNGGVLELHQNDFIFAGIELNHFYYPDFIALKKQHIYMNFGSHLGFNTSKYNPSLDLGFSGNALKEWQLNDTHEIRAAFGASILRKNLINFNSVIDLGNNPFLASHETMFEYTTYTRKGNYHSVALNYQFQTSFNKKAEADYYELVGKWKEIHSGWQHGFEQLYKNQSAWNWMYTYGRKNYLFSIYIKEDLAVNNAPDIQTGINLKIPVSRK
jgi:hypothetical protein